jgi:hypothetical protein
VAKGHRGFIDGDFIMMMYAWSPNWKANSVGNDHYNLYARRSFDGGLTWTTTPAPSGRRRHRDLRELRRRLGLHHRLHHLRRRRVRAGPQPLAAHRQQETILDPRYTPTGGSRCCPSPT